MENRDQRKMNLSQLEEKAWYNDKQFCLRKTMSTNDKEMQNNVMRAQKRKELLRKTLRCENSWSCRQWWCKVKNLNFIRKKRGAEVRDEENDM